MTAELVWAVLEHHGPTLAPARHRLKVEYNSPICQGMYHRTWRILEPEEYERYRACKACERRFYACMAPATILVPVDYPVDEEEAEAELAALRDVSSLLRMWAARLPEYNPVALQFSAAGERIAEGIAARMMMREEA